VIFLCIQLILFRLLISFIHFLQKASNKHKSLAHLLLLECADMLSCSRVELMTSVLAQVYLLNYNMVPYLTLALLFMTIVVFVTVFVITTAKDATRSLPILMLVVLKETRYIIFPAMLLLTESPFTQLILLIMVNTLTTLLCIYSVCHYPCFKWAGLYLIVESVFMLLVELYLLVNRELQDYSDYVMIALMGAMIGLFGCVPQAVVFECQEGLPQPWLLAEEEREEIGG
jgi:hypothetical protein